MFLADASCSGPKQQLGEEFDIWTCGLWSYITGWSLSSGWICKKSYCGIQIVVLNERWSLSSGGLQDRFYCYWKGSSWRLGCVRYVEKMLWSSVVKLAKKFNSTSFNLKQEAFIRRDEDWPEEGWYLYRNWFDTFVITRWTVKFNIHTSYGGRLICDQCHCRCE